MFQAVMVPNEQGSKRPTLQGTKLPSHQ